jgi:hypothetical protein
MRQEHNFFFSVRYGERENLGPFPTAGAKVTQVINGLRAVHNWIGSLAISFGSMAEASRRALRVLHGIVAELTPEA